MRARGLALISSLFFSSYQRKAGATLMTAVKLECCCREGKSTLQLQLRITDFQPSQCISCNQFWLMEYEWKLLALLPGKLENVNGVLVSQTGPCRYKDNILVDGKPIG